MCLTSFILPRNEEKGSRRLSWSYNNWLSWSLETKGHIGVSESNLACLNCLEGFWWPTLVLKSIVTILERVLVAHLNLIDLKVYYRSWNLVQTCFGNRLLERTWYRTQTPWTIVSTPLNIPRKIIYFCEQPQKTPYIRDWPIESNYLLIIHCFWSVVPFDLYKGAINSRKVEKHSIGCSDSFYYERKDSTRDLCIVLQYSRD